MVVYSSIRVIYDSKTSLLKWCLYHPRFQVKWAKDNLDGYLNFYSVSGDGRVTNWTIVKTALWYTDIMFISFSKSLENFSDAVRDKLRGTYLVQLERFPNRFLTVIF